MADHGSEPATLYLSGSALTEAVSEAAHLPSWELTPWQLAELELLLDGALTPLQGYLDQADFNAVLQRGETADGIALSWPLSLDVELDFAGTLQRGSTIALRDCQGLLVALLDVSDIWEPDPQFLVDHLAGPSRAFGRWLREEGHSVRLGGSLRGIRPPGHYDFTRLRAAPAEVRARLRRRGWDRVLAVMTDQPIGPGEHTLVLAHARALEANLLLLPSGLAAEPGDVRYHARLRSFTQTLGRFPDPITEAALVPLLPHRGATAETALRETVARNYGATHVLHLDPGTPEATRSSVARLGLTRVPRGQIRYQPDRGRYTLSPAAASDDHALPCDISECIARLQAGEPVPDWLGWPEQVRALAPAWPARRDQGITLFLTGLSGAGKSTLGRALRSKLMERGTRPVSLLDSDILRQRLASELGYSRAHRDRNIERIGHVAAEITRNGGVAICAAIAPYAEARQQVRDTIETIGGFMEIHVATPLEVCEQRDQQGLYARARAGLINDFTGISDPYEAPEAPELRIDATSTNPDQAAQQILLKLAALGYL